MCGPPREQCLGGSDYGYPKRRREVEWSAEDQYIDDCISRDLGASEEEIANMKGEKDD